MALNRGWAYHSEIDHRAAGRTLLAHLAEAFPHSDERTWAARLAEGQVTVSGKVATGDERLSAGQRLVWQRPPWDEPDVPLTFDILHEDSAILVVHKPAGLPTLPAGGFLEHTLWACVRAHDPMARPLHRLGRFTSGLVVFARTHDAAGVLSRHWREHRVTKVYRALGSGSPTWQRRVIDVPIGPVPHPVLGSVHAASPAGKPARSEASVLGRRSADTLFDVSITTGRPHQIRIHLAAAGHPLVGDPLYITGGVPHPDRRSLPGDGGYLLHAHRVSFCHPTSGDEIRVEAPLPAGLA